jgi:hypothetical protein
MKYVTYGQKLIHTLTSRMTATESIFTKIKFSKLLVKKDISGDEIFAKQLKQFVRSIPGYVVRTVLGSLSRRKVLHSADVLGSWVVYRHKNYISGSDLTATSPSL